MPSAVIAGSASRIRGEVSGELSVDEASAILSREERFMATVYAMNTLLIHKGMYTQQEFDALFCRWAKTQTRRPMGQRPGWGFFSRLFRK